MKDNRGITLISVMITILLLIMIAGIVITQGAGTFEKSKVVRFETNMKTIQKKVDIIMEEGTEYPGSSMPSSAKEKLKQIIANDATTNYIKTTNIEEPLLRYFSSQDIEEILELEDIQDEIVVNFSNGEVISLNGIEKDGNMYYVENGLY